MTVPSYTEEDVELVARALAESLNDSCFAEKNTGTRWESFRAVYRQDAKTVLDFLSSAGRLVPPGSEVREERGFRATPGDPIAPAVRRLVITTPWVPDTKEGSKDG